MAFQLPIPEEVGGAPWPHEPYLYESYKAVHWRYITDLANEGLILHDGLDWDEVKIGRRLESVYIRGLLTCSNGVMIRVNKELEVSRNNSGHLYVRGRDYAYHAWFKATNQEILRYDMAHQHQAGLHVHLVDPTTGEEQVTAIERDQLPTLGDFVRIAIARAELF